MVIRSNARRQKDWSSEEEAMRWMKTHSPWKTFHPDVLQIISVSVYGFSCFPLLLLLLFLIPIKWKVKLI